MDSEYHTNVLYPNHGLAQSLGAYERAILTLAESGRQTKAVLLLGDAEAAGLVLREEIYGEIIRACGKVRKLLPGEGSRRPIRSIHQVRLGEQGCHRRCDAIIMVFTARASERSRG